jgi:hypothetical protein
MQFCKWLQHQHTVDWLFVHNILWRNEVCFMFEGVFNVHNTHLWPWDNPHATHECGYQVCFIISVRADVIGDIVMGPYMPLNRLAA